MERMKAHAIAPGTDGQVLTTTGGRAAWGFVPGSEPELPEGGTEGQVLTIGAGGTLAWADPADTGSGVPAVGPNGQVLTVVNGAPAWADAPDGLPNLGTDGQVLTIVDGVVVWADPQGTGIPGTPVVMGSSSNAVADGPYTCPLPVGITADFDGLFVLAIHYDVAPIWSAMVDGIVSSGGGNPAQWEPWAWAGQPGGPGVMIVAGPPREVVSVDTGGGAAQVFLAAVAGATVVRGDPGREVVVTEVTSTAGWSTRNGDVIHDADAGVRAYASLDDPSPVSYLYAELDWDETVDLTDSRYVDIDWHAFEEPDSSLTAFADGVQLEFVRSGVSPLRSDYRRSTFRHPTGDVVEQLRFRCGPFGNGGPGYDLWVKRVARVASSHGRASTGPAGGISVDDPGIPALAGDLLLWVGGSQLDSPTSTTAVPDATVVQSRTQENYTGILWSATVTEGGYQQPHYDALGPSLETDVVAVAGIVLGGTAGSGGGGGGGASTLDQLDDVDTTTVAPADGDALVYDVADQKWKPGQVTGGGGGIPADADYVATFEAAML